ncbi:MAG TPA: PAS domain-containing protein, partial [Clostridia bacterium]|nr:PAS domain-containing protein [Clostridia bacterium]
GLSIMWALHDVVRARLKKAIDIIKDDNSTEEQLNRAIADIFFGMLGLKKKEELILFPSASEVLSEDDWHQMYKQSLEYDFPFIEKPDVKTDDETEIFEGGKFKTETGELDFEDILMIFNALPVDLTFVDENNKVKFFTRPKDRIFPRSPAIIGRDVDNCHPPSSVHIVEEIIESFRSGKEDSAKFWINVKDKMILIQYFALRDNEEIYRGTLEVSQDITEIKQLEGERRLLKWNEGEL